MREERIDEKEKNEMKCEGRQERAREGKGEQVKKNDELRDKREDEEEMRFGKGKRGTR